MPSLGSEFRSRDQECNYVANQTSNIMIYLGRAVHMVPIDAQLKQKAYRLSKKEAPAQCEARTRDLEIPHDPVSRDLRVTRSTD